MNSRSSQRAGSFAMCLTGRNLRRLAVFCTLFLGLSFHALGQEATVVGTVTDPSGSVVPKAKVTVSNVDTGVTSETTSGDDGGYQVRCTGCPPSAFRWPRSDFRWPRSAADGGPSAFPWSRFAVDRR